MARVTQQTLSKLAVVAEDQALDLEEVKKQRKLGSGTSMTSLLNLWITAATEQFEAETGRQVLRARWEYRLDCFPPDRFIEIPKAPLLRVLSVTYADGGSPSLATLDSAQYETHAPLGPTCPPGRIQLVSGATWPTPLEQEAAVVITFEAGYGNRSGDVPASIRAALLYLVGHFHKFGEEVVGGTHANSLQVLPLGATTMMRNFKWTARATQRPWSVPWLG